MSDAITAVKRALISVSDKSGIVDFARALADSGVHLLSTGGTAALLAEQGIAVTDVAAHTGFPEIMGGRVKTLHPKIHGGILGRRGVDEAVMAEQGIDAIDMVVVNLYPFAETVARADCTLEEAIENIDIGGPGMLRAAAKNYRDVAVVADPADYAGLQAALQARGGLSIDERYTLAVKAFAHTAQYDSTVASYLGAASSEPFPNTLHLQFDKVQTMRYGENPHQSAAFYRDRQSGDKQANAASVATAHQRQGKALSFNNIADADAALECVKQFDQAACVIVKHTNPCGVALGDSLQMAYDRAYQTDPTSAFGGVIAFNRALDAATARAIVERQFVEVIIAPGVSDDAIEMLGHKTNVRMLDCGELGEVTSGLDFKRINGGLLVQDPDVADLSDDDLRVVSERQPSATELADMLFAWRVAKFVKSNAIVYCRDLQTVGIGAGQMSRVYSARIAGIKAADEGLPVEGSVMASDAFFPFRDGIDSAAAVGVRAIIQPGGSLRDEEVIAAANEHGIAMVFTGIRHFRH